MAAHQKPNKADYNHIEAYKLQWEYILYRNPSRCHGAKGKCIGIIPLDVRATFLSLLLPSPQLS